MVQHRIALADLLNTNLSQLSFLLLIKTLEKA